MFDELKPGEGRGKGSYRKTTWDPTELRSPWFVAIWLSFFFIRKLQATVAQIAERCPDFLSPEQDHLLSEKPSLKGLSERVDKLKQQTFLQVHRMAA